MYRRHLSVSDELAYRLGHGNYPGINYKEAAKWFAYTTDIDLFTSTAITSDFSLTVLEDFLLSFAGPTMRQEEYQLWAEEGLFSVESLLVEHPPKHENVGDHVDKIEPSRRSCSLCGRPEGPKEPKLMICSGCRNASYCNVLCQRGHWPRHKDLCGKER